eukprot:6482699-Amphidinium_carterae.1
MATSQSQAMFAHMVKATGMEDKLPRLQELGLLTANKFSFATGFAPGQGDPALLVAELIKPIFGDEYTPSQAASVRQLHTVNHTECYALALEDLKRRTERTEGDAPRKVPHIEKAARMKVLTDRLPGVPVYGEYEPSDSLVDLCLQMAFDEAITYV